MFENLKTAYRFMTICVSERLTLALRGGLLQLPLGFFRGGRKTAARSAAKFGTTYDASFAHLLVQKTL